MDTSTSINTQVNEKFVQGPIESLVREINMEIDDAHQLLNDLESKVHPVLGPYPPEPSSTVDGGTPDVSAMRVSLLEAQSKIRALHSRLRVLTERVEL